MTAQREAIQIFRRVAGDLASGQGDLNAAMLQCLQACRLLGWTEEISWLERELYGYPADGVPPEYRRIPGRRIWRLGGSTHAVAQAAVRSMWGDLEYDDEAEQISTLAYGAIESILVARGVGYSNVTGQTKELGSYSSLGPTVLKRVDVYPAASVEGVLREIERRVFHMATEAYASLQFGDEIAGVWGSYRRDAEEAMQRLGVADHFEVIRSGLRSNNPQEWRSAVFGCRSLIDDLADQLWQDPRPTYDLLPGSARNGRLPVERGKSKNRLRAYLHQKSVHGNRAKFLVAELGRVADSVDALHDLTNSAHGQIQLVDLRSIAVATYFAVAEICSRTDLQPVVEYTD